MGNPATGEPSGPYQRKSLMDTMAVAPELQTREESVATTGVQQATLTVWKFPTATGAAEAVKTVKTLQQQRLINLLDAAIVSWPENKSKPKTQQLGGFPGLGALIAYTSGAIVDKVQAAMKSHNPTLLTSNLSADQEKRLREAFAEEAG